MHTRPCINLFRRSSRNRGNMKNRELHVEMESDFFFVHDSIIFGAMKKCHIRLDSDSYDDFVQIGRLKLMEAYEQFPNDLFNEEFFYQFTGYAYRKVYWGLLDQIRKEQKKHEREEKLPEQFEQLNTDQTEAFEEDVLFWSLFQSMLYCLNEQEQQYLKDAVIEQLSVTEISKKRKISRKTVYQRKKRIAKKLQHFYTVLKT